MDEVDKDLNSEKIEMHQLLEQTPSLDLGKIVSAKVVNISNEYIFVDLGLKSEGLIPVKEFSHSGESEFPKVGSEIPVVVYSSEGVNGHPSVSFRQAYTKIMREKIEKANSLNLTLEGTVIKRIKGGWLMDLGEEAFLPFSQSTLDGNTGENLMGKKLQVKILEWAPEKNNLVVSHRKLLEEERLREKEKTLKDLQIGQIRSGKVKNLTTFGAFVNLGGIDGLVHINDVSWQHLQHPKEVLKVGQEVEVKVLKLDLAQGKISLGIKQLFPNPWEDVQKKYLVGSKVEGKVVSFTDFGAFVELEPGIEGLVHISELSWKERIERPERILKIGQSCTLQILSVNKEKGKISLSLKKAEVNPWQEAAKKYPVGSKVRGKINRIVPFGAFLRLEDLGLDGLIQVSDIFWMRKIQHPGNVLKLDQELEAVVLEINPADEKIRLGIKQLSANPFLRYKEGSIVEGKIVRLTDFGAFVQLEDGIEGLVHISEMSRQRIAHPSEVLKVDEVIKAKVLKADESKRKIDLSIKRYDKEKEREEIEKYLATNGEKLTLRQMLDEKLNDQN